MLLALSASFGFGAAGLPALDDSEIVLLQPCLPRGPLADAINAYATPEGILVPFSEVCRLLSFGITVDTDKGKAEGFFISDKHRFSLDIGAGFAETDGRKIPIAPLTARTYNREIFVDARLLEAWFPLEVKADLKAAVLLFKSKEKLPVEDQWDREGRYAGLGSGPVSAAQDHPIGAFLPDPYRAIDIPFLDVNTAWVHSQHGTTNQPQASLSLAADLLWMSSTLFVNRDSEGHVKDTRYTLFREDPRGDLLGPLHAQRVELGNLLDNPSLDLAGDLPSGRGALVDNYPIGYRSKFATRNFQGSLPEGWTVELYQNNALTGVQHSRPDGLYEFKDVPLRFGLNQFRFVFHGPQGQRREETFRADIANDLPPPGTLYYRLAGVKLDGSNETGVPPEVQAQANDALTHAASFGEVDYGLSRTLALHAGYAKAPLLDGIHQYTVGGFRGMFSYLSLQGNAAQDKGPLDHLGKALEGELRTGYDYTSFSLRRSTYRDGFEKMGCLTGSTRLLADETVADLFGTVTLGKNPVGLSLTREARDYVDGGRTVQDRIRATFNVGSFAISPSLSRLQDSQQPGSTPIDAEVFATWFSDSNSFQGELSARRSETGTVLKDWQAIVDHTARSGLIYRLGLKGPDTRLTNASVLAGVSKLTGRFGFGIDMEYAKSSGYTIGLRAQISFCREPRTGRWVTSALPQSSLGAMSAVAYMDANGNGQLDPGERVLEGTQFKTSGLAAENAIKDSEVTFKTSLPRAQEIPVQLDETTLEDPAMKPTVGTYRIIPRTGRTTLVGIPIAYFGEIIGTTRLRQDGTVRDFGGIELELLKGTGERVRLLRSAYDGFFELTNLPLGEYLLRVSPQEAARLHLKEPPVRRFQVDSVKNLFEGQDFILEELPALGAGEPTSTQPSAPQPGETP